MVKTTIEHGDLGTVQTTLFSAIWSWVKWIRVELVTEFPDNLAFIAKWDFKGSHNVKILVSIKTPSFFVLRFGIHII